jgi:predicted nucleotidyltransferase
MNITEIKEVVDTTEEYGFIKSIPNIILLGLGGSYAYGTNNENSDIDIRGVAMNTKQEILTGRDFEQVVDTPTDTTIYSFNKIVKLLCNCNPNTIEILGLNPDQYLYLSDLGKKLVDNRYMFLSKKAVYTFGGYANSQLRRLENKSARTVGQEENERHILKTINHAYIDFKEKYIPTPDDAIKLYVDKSNREDFDSEIFMDIRLNHYPLRDWSEMWNEMKSIVRSYSKISKRNSRAIEHDKLGKHMMHLVRLYLMCLDILERGEIITYRAEEHDFLMSIRNGYYLKDSVPTEEFYEIVDDYEKRLDEAARTTKLPDVPDYDKINKFIADCNEKVVRGELI